jgi:H+/Cl- antiporter ClcA
VGSACAGFLWSLDTVTHLRVNHPWLLCCLPLFGALEAWMYRWLGREAEAGSNLVIDSSHEAATGIQTRMAPLVYFGTMLTHLGVGSAGREGTAVQMRGGIAIALARWYRMGQSPDKKSF